MGAEEMGFAANAFFAGVEMREITFTTAAREGLAEEMAKDPTIFVVGEGIGPRGGNFNTTTGLYDLYGPERLRDTPICERGFVGLCAGAAMTGTRPVVDFMFLDFIMDAFGELANQVAKIRYMSSGRLKMPMVLRGCIGVGGSAATHHSGNYYPIFAHLPGFRVALPTTPYDAKGLIKTALRSDDPVLFLEHRSLLNEKGSVPEEEYTIPFGRAVVRRPGKDITVVALTLMVRKALEAGESLDREGVSVEVIDPRTVAPLDMDTILESVRRTGRLLVVDETFGPCGIGAEISAQVTESAFDHLDAPVRRLNGAHTPTPYSAPLEAAVVPQVEDIVQAVRELAEE
jgi:2-oxoisovalerate dehydrogenase E1 component